MNTDIETRLREEGSTVELNRTVDEIFGRGDRLRRRRTHTLVGSGVVATVAVLAGSVALPPGSNPVVGPAVASWSGGTTNLEPGELQAVADICLDRLGSIPAGTMPLAAESRAGTVVAYFRHDENEATCVAEQRPAGTLRFFSGSETEYEPLPAGTHLGDSTGFGAADPGLEGGPVTSLWNANEVSPDVARVSAEIGSETFDGTVVDGVALFWLTGSFSPHQVDDAVFTAYDGDGAVLTRVDPAAVAQEPQGPNDDRGR